MKFATKVIHKGQEPDPSTGAVIPPIYMTSTFAQEAPGVNRGYEYTRAGNPNFTYLEQQVANLEGAQYATVFSSGMGALTALVSSLSQGDRVVAVDGVYGGTWRLFNQVFNRFGIQYDSFPVDQIEKALKGAKWLFFETPTNPLLEVFDIAALAKLAKREGLLTVVDNTFACPYNQNPLTLGVDVVLHSSTKYLGGHSDVVGGVVMTNNLDIQTAAHFGRKALGLNPSPFDCWLVSRGIKTLAVRMEKHNSNALAIAQFLDKHFCVKKVYYPGLETHPGYAVAKKQMCGFGGMVSAEFNLSLEKTKELISNFKLFTLAESLGGVESLVSHPATMTHASLSPEVRERMGITCGLVRFSVGIEDTQDLIDDLAASLDKCVT